MYQGTAYGGTKSYIVSDIEMNPVTNSYVMKLTSPEDGSRISPSFNDTNFRNMH